MDIPFCRPLIDDAVKAEVADCLNNTGWLSSGPKTLELEQQTKALTGAQAVVCVNSWTSGAMLALRWFGVGPGDEVIVPAYTYAATALCVMNLGAKVVMVDVKDDFTIDDQLIKAAITSKTKVIIPVDIGGWMADYDNIFAAVQSPEATRLFQPSSPEQVKLGRILVLADAAHSIGARYKGKSAGTCADISVMSFHSVKNITTGEGGAVCLQLPAPFDTDTTYRFLKVFSLNGQTKSTFEKNQPGIWRYDIVAQGIKANMPDICAAIGLAQIRRYTSDLLPDREGLFEQYLRGFEPLDWAILPPWNAPDGCRSSAHLFMLRIKGMQEAGRDSLIAAMASQGIGTNVHYIPLPMLSLFKNLGYQIEQYPQAYALYQNEISLPIFNGLTTAETDRVIKAVRGCVESVHLLGQIS